MGNIKVKYEAKDCAISNLEIDAKLVMRVLRVGERQLTQLKIGDRTIIQRGSIGSRIGEWNIPDEYIERLNKREEMLIEAFDMANDSADPAGN